VNYNQLEFWLLFLGVYVLYWRLNHRQQNILLLVVSYLFYGFWDYRFVFLILLSTVIDFIGGLGVAGERLTRRTLWRLGAGVIAGALLLCSNAQYGLLWRGILQGSCSLVVTSLPHRLRDFAIPLAVAAAMVAYGLVLPRLYAAQNRRRYFLIISIAANLGILGFFKYCGFFISSFRDLLTALGVAHVNLPTLALILPAGISFYTFQAMSYTIDIYRDEMKPITRFTDFAVFVSFFPHLVAGPIMRARTLLPQVVRPRHRRPGDLEEGLFLVVMGLFKKIAISDNMAPIVNAVFYRLGDGKLDGMSGADVLVGVYAFALQIYGDFSGYSSIARGISKWLGFELVINFHLPYLAVSPSDFWRRWHISLSTWLRDYLYISLGGNRHGVRREYRNLMITMLLGGLWHGARWTFVAWGLYHGAILCIYRLLGIKDVKREDGVVPWLVRVVLMFHLTCVGWLLFRADHFTAVTRAVWLVGHFHLTPFAVSTFALVVFYGLFAFVLEIFLDGENRLRRLLDAPWPAQSAVYAYLTVMIVLFCAEQSHELIYFQF
jgi:alginate O-acetyltransferase complex protein AlgI